MDFHDFPMILGKSGKYENHPPKLCASLLSAEVEPRQLQQLAQLPQGMPPRALAQAFLRRLQMAILAAPTGSFRVVDTNALEVRAAGLTERRINIGDMPSLGKIDKHTLFRISK